MPMHATPADQLLNMLRDMSRARIAQQPGDFIGVVLSRTTEAGKQPTWHLFAFPTRAELDAWYGDWVGNTAEYGYLASIDRTVSNDPQQEAGLGERRTRMIAPAPESGALVASSGDPSPDYGPFDRLQDLVARHETFWAMIAQQNPHSQLMRWWMTENWDPFYARWTDLVTRHGLSNVDTDVIAGELARLNGLRRLAHDHGLPLPPGKLPITITAGGHHGGGHGGGGHHGGGGLHRRGRGWGGGYGGGYYDDWYGDVYLYNPDEDGDDDADALVIAQGEHIRRQLTSAHQEQAMTKPNGRYTQLIGVDHRSTGPGTPIATAPSTYPTPHPAAPPVPGGDHRTGPQQGAPARPPQFGGRPVAQQPIVRPMYPQGGGPHYAQPQQQHHVPFVPPNTYGGYHTPHQPIPRPYTGVPANRGRWSGAYQGRPNYGGGGGHPGGRWGRGGFYRHGSRWPGRWIHGNGGIPVWFEGPQNMDDDSDPVSDQPPPSEDDVPITDPGQPEDGGDTQEGVDSAAAADAGADAGGDAGGGVSVSDATAVAQGWRHPPMTHRPEYHHINENPLLMAGAVATPIAASQIVRGEPVAVGGACGTRSFTNVNHAALLTILQRLQAKGGEITGNNPYRVVTHEHGVELLGTWDAASGSLQLEVVNGDAPCFAIWNQITDWLAELGAKEVVSGETFVRAAIVSGFWDSLENAALTITGTKITNQFISDHHLQPYVQLAATAVATAYGGPAAGAAAGALSGPVMSLGVRPQPGAAPQPDPQAAQAAITAATQAAKANPKNAAALNIAHKAVTSAAAGMHVAATIQQAAKGDPAAQKQVANLAQAHDAGDPRAKAALDLASAVTSYLAQKNDPHNARNANWTVDDAAIQIDPPANNGVDASLIEMDPPDTSASATVSGVIAGDPRAIARTAATAADGKVIGVVIPKDNPLQVQVFATADDADDWYGQWLGMPHAFEYVAYFDKGDQSFPGPLNEQLSPQAKVRASGILAPFLLGMGAGFAGGAYGAGRYITSRQQKAAQLKLIEDAKASAKAVPKVSGRWNAIAMYGAR